MLKGRWQYIKVLKNDSVLFPIVDTDYLEFYGDSSFRYVIEAAKKDNFGFWQYKNHQLILKYTNPDTIRYFDIEIISNRDLIFNEDNKKFVLKR